MGALEDILFQALGGAAKPDFAAGDPYAEPQKYVETALTTPILQSAIKPDHNGFGTGELMGAALISGLLGGGLGGLSKGYQNEQKGLYRDYLLQGALGGGLNASPDLDPSLLDVGNQNLSLFGVANKLDETRANREFLQKGQLAAAEAIGRNPYAAPKIIKGLEQLGMLKSGAEPMLKQTNPTAAQSDIVERDLLAPQLDTTAKPARSVEGGYLDEMAGEAKRLLETGDYTPAQANEAAREAFKGKREEISKQYERIQESAKAGQELNTLTDQMEFYLSKAGNTGWGGDAAQYMAGAAGLVSPNQKEKYSAGQQLESLGTEVIKATGKVLKGPMSDADIKLLLRAGPRLADEESANTEIINRWRYAANLQDKYSDFMRNAQNSGLPVTKAEEAWRDLVKANPYLIRNQAGVLVPNASWMQALSGEPNAGGEGATQTTQAPRPVPSQYKNPAEYVQAFRAWEASQ